MRRPAWWPTGREEELLRLLLDPGADPTPSRRSLIEAAAAPSDEERRLLPLLHHRLATDSAPPLDLPAATAATLRRSWAESRSLRLLALRQAGEVLAALGEVGVTAAPLKGLAIEAWYGGAGRPIGDLDLLIPEERLGTALARLEADGYTPRDEVDPDAVRAKHSCALGRAGSAEVDLHWLLDVRLAGGDGRAAAMAPFWRGGERVQWCGAEVLRLRPEHHVVHALLHGARVDSRAQARWIVDALTIVRSAGAGFVWEEVVAIACRARLSGWFHAALDRLESLAPGSVPAGARHRLAVSRRAAAERLLWLLDRTAAPEGVPRDVQRTLRWHLARSRRLGLARALLSYPRYLRRAGLVASPGDLVAHLGRRRREKRARRLA